MVSDEKADIQFDYGQYSPNTASGVSTISENATPTDPEGEKRVRDAIAEAAPQNADLLSEIMSTHDAVHALQNNEARLSHLNEELKTQDRLVQDATLTTKTYFAKYTKARDSFTRKWFYVLTNMRQNLEKKRTECETAYHEALNAQSKAEQRQQKLKQDKDAIEQENVGVTEQAKRHGEAHSQIDQLYSNIFDGKTPGFPDEDEAEANFRTQKDEHEATMQTLKAITALAKQSALLKSTIARAQKENNQGRYELETSLFSGADYALVRLDRCVRLVDQALNVHHKIMEDLPQPHDRDFVQIHFGLFQNLSNAKASAVSALSVGYAYASSSQLFSTIQGVADDLRLAIDAHAAMARLLKEYQTTAREAVKITSRVMEDSRQALQEIRQNAFEITVGHGAAPPPFHECCDRAEGFENDANAQCERIPDPTIDDSGLPPPPSYDQVTTEDQQERPS